MPTLTIDGREIHVADGATILEAARALGIAIPTLCFREGYEAETSCMVCVVRVNGSDHLVPSCATKAEDGMVVESETDQIKAARRIALELLLGDHLGDCIAPCQSTCPLHLNIPEMIGLVAEGRIDAAVATVRERIPLSAVLSHICPAPCEKGCRRGQLDSPVAIRLLKRYIAECALAQGDIEVPECAPDTGRKVAIVGAGPTGLSASYYLRRAGHACTVFDEHDQAGGMLRHGVQEARLPRRVLDTEIDAILALGMDLRMNTRIGQDVSMQDLREEFDAVVVATGQMSAEGASALGLPMAGRGLEADHHMQTMSADGVFVAGAALFPSRHTARAVASGKSAAQSIIHYLAGEPITAPQRLFSVHMGQLSEQEMRAFSATASPEERLVPSGGSTAGFTEGEAIREARRCLHCECVGLEDCRLREWAMRYGANPNRYRTHGRTFSREISHPLVIYEPGKCIACGLCVQIAKNAAERLGLTFIGRGFDVAVSVPFGESLASGLEKVAAECAQACPTAAITLRNAEIADDTSEFTPLPHVEPRVRRSRRARIPKRRRFPRQFRSARTRRRRR
jgi:ferredoxin